MQAQAKPAFNKWSAEFDEYDIIAMSEFIDFLNESSDVPLVRQDAKTGDDLLRSVGGLRCRKNLNGKGKGCPREIIKYGMCSVHWKKWKKENPWLNYPGHY